MPGSPGHAQGVRCQSLAVAVELWDVVVVVVDVLAPHGVTVGKSLHDGCMPICHVLPIIVAASNDAGRFVVPVSDKDTIWVNPVGSFQKDL